MNRSDVLRVLAANGPAAPSPGPEAPGPETAAEPVATAQTPGNPLDAMEQLFQFLERAEPLFDKFSARIIQIKQWESRNMGSDESGGGMDDLADAFYISEDDPPGRGPIHNGKPAVGASTGGATEAKPNTLGAAAPPEGFPIKLFQWLCGALSSQPMDTPVETVFANMMGQLGMPAGMTVKTALEMLRDGKSIVLAVIEAKIQEIADA